MREKKATKTRDSVIFDAVAMFSESGQVVVIHQFKCILKVSLLPLLFHSFFVFVFSSLCFLRLLSFFSSSLPSHTHAFPLPSFPPAFPFPLRTTQTETLSLCCLLLLVLPHTHTLLSHSQTTATLQQKSKPATNNHAGLNFNPVIVEYLLAIEFDV